jgi:hypothetical protein
MLKRESPKNFDVIVSAKFVILRFRFGEGLQFGGTPFDCANGS